LIYPPVRSFFIQANYLFYGLAPPLGLLYLASALEQQGHKVTILDFSAEPYEKKKVKSRILSTDMVGITILSSAIVEAKKIIALIRENDNEIPIIIGGPHCTLFPKKTLQETAADICIQGEGEQVITKLNNPLEINQKLKSIPGIHYRIKNQITSGLPAKPIQNLDTISFPARHLVQRYIYGKGYNPKIKAMKFTSIITSRGCPFSCRFCSRGSIGFRQYRTRSIENIIEELILIQKQGYTHVAINDDSFPVDTHHAHALFDAVLKENINLKFLITAARVDTAEKTLYRKMKDAGIIHIQYGLESGNQEVLDFYKKQITIQQIQNAVHLAHDIGFFTAGSFIFGAPFETKRLFKNTLSFAKSLPLDSVSFLPLRYMAGSELWTTAVEEHKISTEDYIVEADSEKKLGLYTREQLNTFCTTAQIQFYLRARFIYHLLRSAIQRNNPQILSIYFSLIIKQNQTQPLQDINTNCDRLC
jgi:radical SAM superfamily enzyme YgiQ (UPF0313 family)